MKRLVWAIIVVTMLCGTAWANDVFLTAAGSGSQSGLDCSNTKPLSYFNASGNWSGSPSGAQIGPGTTVHISSTFTGSLSANAFIFQGSGSSGSPVIVLGDSCVSAPDITSPAWGQAFNTNGFNHLIIDGGGTGDAGSRSTNFSPVGIIENTANGTSLANQVASKGILIPNGTDIIVRNWQIKNLYQRSGHLTESFDETTVAFVYGGTVAPPNQVVITNNQMIGGGWGIQNVGASDQWTISHNDISLAEHSASVASTILLFFKNHLHDWGVWDSHLTCQGGTNNGTSCTSNGQCNSNDCGYSYHHDGLHCFALSGGQTQFLLFAGNQIDGATDDGTTNEGQFNQGLFVEGHGSPTTCMLPGGKVYAYNNVCVLSSDAPGCNLDTGNSTTGNSGDIIANNTDVGNSPSNTAVSGNNVQGITSATVVNNAYSGFGAEIASTGGVAPFAQLDYNYYQNCSTTNCFFVGGVADTGSFAAWLVSSCTLLPNSCDQHGGANLASTTYLGLDAGCIPGSLGDPCKPQNGSPLIGGAENLTSLCSGMYLADLCNDIDGNPRPATGPWDAGAVNGGNSSVPSAPTNVNVVVK